MNIVIVGCGRIGAELAYRLYQQGHQVAVIDLVSTAFNNLPPDFRGRTVVGDVLCQDVLHRAGLGQADGLAAVTPFDPLNAVVAHVARLVYHVPNIVVRNYDPRWRSLHEAFGLQMISSSSWGAQRFEELLVGTAMRTIFSAGNGEVELCEVVVSEAWHGRRLTALLPVEQAIPVAVTRAGRAVLPSAELQLEAGDIVHLSVTQAGIEALHRQLSLAKEG